MKKHFTIIELLVVISVIAILIALVFPALTKAKKMGKKTSCVSNLKQIGTAIESYTQDNESYFPWNCTSYGVSEPDRILINNVLKPYLPNSDLFRCPDDNSNLFTSEGCSYLWNRYQTELPGNEIIGKTKYDTGLQGMIEASSFPLMSDSGPFHGKSGSLNSINVLYTNGRVDDAAEIPFL